MSPSSTSSSTSSTSSSTCSTSSCSTSSCSTSSSSKHDRSEDETPVYQIGVLVHRNTPSSVVYFCMEFGLESNLQLYAGGLGILAGDIIKTSVDLDLPLYGVGILWSEGYVAQSIVDGEVKDDFNKVDRTGLCSVDVEVSIKVKGKEMKLRAYRVKSYPKLYLLEPLEIKDREMYTTRLYQGGEEKRICQEMILGIGGVRLFRCLGLHVDIYHFNEGHAVFAGIELIREKSLKKSFRCAWEITKCQVAFTTHTPVKAGNEEHDIKLLMEMGATDGLTEEQIIQIGGSPFSMTVAGLRLSYLTNGVSELHAKTAQEMWSDVVGASSICSITNGVHVDSWQSKDLGEAAGDLTLDLWKIHKSLKSELVEEVYKRTNVRLDSENLIVGFARRATTYKRHNLIFSRLSEISPLLISGRVQFIFAGKAHPEDSEGKSLIKELLKIQEKFPKGIVYLENYDMNIGRLLTSGCDVWMNNPIRPQEASGTSGMKAAMNGVLNLSILDGWWPEGCQDCVNGWKVQASDEDSNLNVDERDAKALSMVLLTKVVPTFYDKREMWIGMMRSSVDMSKQFSSEVMVRKYYDLIYSRCRVEEEEGGPAKKQKA